MKRTRCKMTQAGTCAKNGANLKDGKHKRAAKKRLAKRG